MAGELRKKMRVKVKSRIVVSAVWMAVAALMGASPLAASSLPTSHFALHTSHFPLPTSPLVVSTDGPYISITAALADAQTGDTIEVRGGTYGPLVVEKSVTLEGVDWPIIDGGGVGTVVTLAAPGIVFRGFEVRGSGVEPDRDHAGVTLTASGITVENNRLSDVLFGIFVSQADDAIVRGNDITSKAQYDEGRKGDGLRLWYSRRATVESNHLHEARDAIAWYSEDLIFRDNTIEGGRFGIHLMYCNGAQIERNHLLDNSVGIYAMYSTRVSLRQNDIRRQRGPSGYALGFKDVDYLDVTGNVLSDNRAAIYLDGTPFSPQGYARFTDNILAFNDVGIIMLTAVRGNIFQNNSFWENGEQMAVQGSGFTGDNVWLGNYWSDYTGFDADGDGQGDVPYRSERFFENLTDREPRLRALIYSPVAQTIEFAASSFPIVKPQPKLVDASPRVQPLPLPAFAVASRPPTTGMVLIGLILLILGATVFVQGVLMTHRVPTSTRNTESTKNGQTNSVHSVVSVVNHLNPAILRAQNVVKHYGAAAALNGISFDVEPGQAVALWGANGAGKTTLLKATLGLIHFDGDISVQGHDIKRDGKAARRAIGYVPQEAVFYDMTVQATMEFYARLKGRTANGAVPPAQRIPILLERLGLAEHARKPVPALSGGLKQRLALAVALLADPPVLLLDEPTANLDARARRDYLALLADLHKRDHKTLLFASHRVDEVETLADRVLMLEEGRVVETLTPGDMRLRLAPDVELTLWVAESQRPRALACFEDHGLKARANGRGTVIVETDAAGKLQPLTLLAEQGIEVLDFEMERGRLRN